MIQQIDTNSSLVDKANAAFQTVAMRVVERAKATSTPVIIWRDGKCVSVSPDDAELFMQRAPETQQDADVLDLREAKVAEAFAETVTLSEAKQQLGLD